MTKKYVFKVDGQIVAEADEDMLSASETDDSKWIGTTSAEMNYKAAIGLVTKEDLIEWAEKQNCNMCSIQWKVGEAEVPRGGITFLMPFLYAEDI